MISKVHFSSARGNWKTPKALYEELDKEFHFDCDPCLVTEGTIHDRDMLGSTWGKRNYVNPPYGKALPEWVAKAWLERERGHLVVMLIPSRTDTRWWHDYIMKADEIRFIKGRLKFDDGKNPAPFPSAIIIFKPSTN